MVDASAPQPTWMTEGAERRSRVKSMFSDLASSYDLLNSLICLRLHYRWREIACQKLHLKEGDRALDLCCGTGVFAEPLKKRVGISGKVLGLDFCLPMVKIATNLRRNSGVYSLGDALSLPIASNSFDAVTVGWGIRNVIDIDSAHREIFRVLKPGSRFASVEMAQPRNPLVRSVSIAVFRTVVPALGSLFGKKKAYQYLPESTEKFKSRDQLVVSMESAGFTQVSWQDLMFGNVCIHWGQKP